MAKKKNKKNYLNICGQKVEVIIVDSFPDDPLLRGDFCADTMIIRALRCEKTMQYVFHEAIHCALFVTGWSHKINSEIDEEHLVIALEHSLFGLYDID